MTGAERWKQQNPSADELREQIVGETKIVLASGHHDGKRSLYAKLIVTEDHWSIQWFTDVDGSTEEHNGLPSAIHWYCKVRP